MRPIFLPAAIADLEEIGDYNLTPPENKTRSSPPNKTTCG